MKRKYLTTRDVVLSGEFAMFTNPMFRADRTSYLTPTYSGLLGCAWNIMWKPEIGVDVIAVKIMKKPRVTTMGFMHRQVECTAGGFGRLSEQTYILNPEYLVRIGLYQVMPGDINAMVGKYTNMLDRAIASGGRRIVYLGCKECLCDVQAATKGWDEYVSELVGEDSFGPIFHHHDKDTGKRFFIRNCVAVDGVIDFSAQELMEVNQ